MNQVLSKTSAAATAPSALPMSDHQLWLSELVHELVMPATLATLAASLLQTNNLPRPSSTRGVSF